MTKRPSILALAGQRGATCALLITLALAGCAGGVQAPAGAPVADPAATAAELTRVTTPSSPQRLTFGWTLNEAGSRVAGRGVVRAQAPDRIRLDLFGPRNETLLAAALIGDEYRMPAAVAGRVALPSAALLWGGLGVIRPPAGSQIVSVTAAEGSATLRYRAGDGTVYQYVTSGAGAATRLESLERSGTGGPVETVRIVRGDDGRIRRTEYRNWAEYRDLILELEEVTDVASFPEDTWRP